MATIKTDDEIEQGMGESLRVLRLQRNLDQATVAERSGISVRSLRNLENGAGSTLRTFLAVTRTLGRESWFETLAPVATINPLTLPRKNSQRQRASSVASKQATSAKSLTQVISRRSTMK